MRFEFTEEEEMLRNQIRRLTREKIAPLSNAVAEKEESREIALQIIRLLGDQGFCGLYVPQEFGGAGISSVGICIVREELSKVSHLADLLFAELGLATFGITLEGNEEQKRSYLPRVARGEILGSFSLTEPNAGSDVAALQARAKRDGDSYLLSGEKAFASVAGLADLCLIFAKTDMEKGRKGISAFLVEAGTPGVEIRPMEMMAGSPEYSVYLEDCRLPAANRLGKEGAGWDIAFGTLDTFRVTVGAAMLGVAEAAFEEAFSYARKRVAFGRPIAEFQATQLKLANMAMEIEAARWLVYRAAHLKDEGKVSRTIKYASMAKLFATEMAWRVADEAVQIHGGSGVTKGVKVEQLLREARLPRIYEGTSEIQRLTIYREMERGF
ncbi:MAG: acyl-CoA dehydrogenase family protein [Deltaproteobacteria bacterium]|nr:acyl-CoA dehydrogenase family protein [Deltaproteobacteria bacterium]